MKNADSVDFETHSVAENIKKTLHSKKKWCTIPFVAGMRAANHTEYALLAQLVEHLTLNQGVQGSSPWRRTPSTDFGGISAGVGTLFLRENYEPRTSHEIGHVGSLLTTVAISKWLYAATAATEEPKVPIKHQISPTHFLLFSFRNSSSLDFYAILYKIEVGSVNQRKLAIKDLIHAGYVFDRTGE